ncbi:MAG: hypothetical protein QUS35_02515 [bacterium]|nr:hypothetical protein [bacterium]
MNTRKAGIVIALAIAVALILAAVSRTGWAVRVRFPDDSSVILDSGGHHIEGNLGEEQIAEWLLKDEGRSIGAFAGDALVSIMTLADAEALRARHGDFFRCDSPGGREAMARLRTVILAAGDADARQGISAAMNRVRKLSIPTVRARVCRVTVTLHTLGGLKVTDHTGTPVFIVRDLELMADDFMKGHP